MAEIRIAAQLHPQHGTFVGLQRSVARAEELGYDILYNWDHFFPLYGSRDGAHFECWTTLAAWAAQTERIELGPLVTCVAYRNADLLADMARTVDQISGGRFVLGLGAGWFDRDYLEYGYRFAPVGRRIDLLEESIARISARLDRLNPGPVRRLPVLIGGVGPRRTLRLVAKHADVWHAMFPERPAELEPLVAALESWCSVEGRDPTTIERAVGVEPDDLERFLAVDADRYLELGFTQFTLGFNGPDWDVARGSDWLAWRDETADRLALA